ncbi:siderophore-interacting protein [Nakamurella sp.]|uniref:siderophore-interacting protein n=1 Tax=Nakamurella sp. TaxID=1869182 RepID=UPI003783E2EC
MQTLPADVMPALEPGRPAYRPFRVQVSRVERLTPSFRQVTFTAPDLREFGDDGLDQRIKLVLPERPDMLDDLTGNAWYERWREMANDVRPVVRTYTVRRVRPRDCEVDVVLVDHESAHGEPGPAVRWLRAVEPGDEIILVGPDVRSHDRHQGIDFRPGGAMESLAGRPDVTARAFVEVPDPADRLPVDLPVNARLHWLARGAGTHGDILGPAVAAWLDGHAGLLDAIRAAGDQPLDDIDVDDELLWDSPDASGEAFYAWMAGEAAAVKSLRRSVVTDRGVDRRQVAFMGYWRRGQAERN